MEVLSTCVCMCISFINVCNVYVCSRINFFLYVLYNINGGVYVISHGAPKASCFYCEFLHSISFYNAETFIEKNNLCDPEKLLYQMSLSFTSKSAICIRFCRIYDTLNESENIPDLGIGNL